MKKALAHCLIAASMLMLWGCPYQSLIPLSGAVEPVEMKMIGSWVPDSDAEKENASYYIIGLSDSVHYDIEHFQYNDSDDSYNVKRYLGHTTTLGKHIFLNMQEVGHKDFHMHRVELQGEGFILYEVTDNIDEKFEDEAEMQKFFEANMHLSFFYNKAEVTLVPKPETGAKE